MDNQEQAHKRESLRQEHEELTQLYIHEDNLAWQLNIGFLAMNAAFVAAIYGIGLFDKAKDPGLLALIILIVAALLDLQTLFTFQRSKIYMGARLNRLYQVEDELEKLGVPIETFGSAERLIGKNKTIDSHGRQRSLKWYEKQEALIIRSTVAILPFLVYLGLLVWFLLKRPGL